MLQIHKLIVRSERLKCVLKSLLFKRRLYYSVDIISESRYRWKEDPKLFELRCKSNMEDINYESEDLIEKLVDIQEILDECRESMIEIEEIGRLLKLLRETQTMTDVNSQIFMKIWTDQFPFKSIICDPVQFIDQIAHPAFTLNIKTPIFWQSILNTLILKYKEFKLLDKLKIVYFLNKHHINTLIAIPELISLKYYDEYPKLKARIEGETHLGLITKILTDIKASQYEDVDLEELFYIYYFLHVYRDEVGVEDIYTEITMKLREELKARTSLEIAAVLHDTHIMDILIFCSKDKKIILLEQTNVLIESLDIFLQDSIKLRREAAFSLGSLEYIIGELLTAHNSQYFIQILQSYLYIKGDIRYMINTEESHPLQIILQIFYNILTVYEDSSTQLNSTLLSSSNKIRGESPQPIINMCNIMAYCAGFYINNWIKPLDKNTFIAEYAQVKEESFQHILEYLYIFGEYLGAEEMKNDLHIEVLRGLRTMIEIDKLYDQITHLLGIQEIQNLLKIFKLLDESSFYHVIAQLTNKFIILQQLILL